MQIHTNVLALGANIAGNWGTPEAAIERAHLEIQRLGLIVQRRSQARETRPMGPTRQPRYHNSALWLAGKWSIFQLFVMLRQLERAAGRRFGPRWSARQLDVDVICLGGRVVGCRNVRTRLKNGQKASQPNSFVPSRAAGRWRPTRAGTIRGRIQLPHPDMHKRTFVLQPMAEVAPHWRHPMTGRSVREMRLQLGVRRPKR